ncbi:Amine sulfotransferase like protein [Argiope bruennichi]|uniref:Amine sulfotransferase like protein n=1 Tax=Argiope bruennichi TaxID=94029 RepID=A0A8T0E8C1_ARGBR|nr:Amine sulfotransferase like protein [Argiope bruennichi]
MSQFGMPPANIIDGLRVPHIFTAESVRSAIQYQPKSDDLFLVTYPKCGTTWAQQILSLIFSQGIPEHSLGEGPFLELKGAQAVETIAATWIHQNSPPLQIGSMGDINFGDYFEHLLGWYEHRNDPNFLFLTYEEMKENPDTTVLKMASFIDNEKYAEPLRKDSEKLNSVLKYSSFQYMKEIANENSEDKPKSSEEQSSNSDHSEKTDASSQMGENEFKKGNAGKSISARLVRKGIVGDWRNHFSKEQSKRMDEKFTEKTKGTNIADLWIKCM